MIRLTAQAAIASGQPNDGANHAVLNAYLHHGVLLTDCSQSCDTTFNPDGFVFETMETGSGVISTAPGEVSVEVYGDRHIEALRARPCETPKGGRDEY